MVNIGIIGLGSNWESRYRPAFVKLSKRIRVRAVYDDIANRSQQAARELRATAKHGIHSLIEQRNVDAILILDTGWYGSSLLPMICQHEKPVYVSGSIGHDVDLIRTSHDWASKRGITFMPELGQRYTPASGRLQELIATHLGKPQKLLLRVDLPAQSGEKTSSPTSQLSKIVPWFDWCRYIFRAAPVEVHCVPEKTGSEFGHKIAVRFASTGQTNDPNPSGIAEILVRFADQETTDVNENAKQHSALKHDVTCAKGSATVHGAANIGWTCGEKANQESLTAERTAEEVMLDIFCRRVVGGLIPVADLNDIYRALSIAQAAEASMETGKPIRLQTPA